MTDINDAAVISTLLSVKKKVLRDAITIFSIVVQGRAHFQILQNFQAEKLRKTKEILLEERQTV